MVGNGSSTPTHLFASPLTKCPACGSTHLGATNDAGSTHFVCEQCGRWWHVELGAVWRVDPQTCEQQKQPEEVRS